MKVQEFLDDDARDYTKSAKENGNTFTVETKTIHWLTLQRLLNCSDFSGITTKNNKLIILTINIL